MDKYETMKSYFYNPETGLTNQRTFYNRMKAVDKTITLNDVRDFFKRQEVNQRLKKIQPQKDDIPKRKIVGSKNAFQMDITYIYNSKFLTLVHILSRYAIMVKISDMNMNTITNTLKPLIKKYNVKALFTDNQFNNNVFKKFCEDNDIQLYTVISKDEHIIKNSNKLGIIDRFTRTIKDYLEKVKISYKSEKVALSKLQSLLKNYNNKIHTSINNTPDKVFNDDDLKYSIYSQLVNYNSQISFRKAEGYVPKGNLRKDEEQAKFNIGDKVRILLKKNVFDKGVQQFSKELYTISEIKNNIYKVDDDKNKTLRRNLRENEILKVDDVDKYVKENIDEEQPKKQRSFARKQKIAGVNEQDIIPRSKRTIKPRERLNL